MKSKIFTLIPVILFLHGCSTSRPDIPDVSLSPHINNLDESVDIISKASKSIRTTVDQSEPEFPGAPWEDIRRETVTIDTGVDKIKDTSGDLKGEESKIKELSKVASSSREEVKKLQEELEKERASSMMRSYGLLVTAGLVTIAAGVALAIFVSPKLGISIGILGIAWLFIGRFLMRWGWVMDMALLVAIPGTLIFCVIRYRGFLFDFITSVNDTLDEEHVPELKEKIDAHSSKNTTKEKEEILKKRS